MVSNIDIKTVFDVSTRVFNISLEFSRTLNTEVRVPE